MVQSERGLVQGVSLRSAGQGELPTSVYSSSESESSSPLDSASTATSRLALANDVIIGGKYWA